jgi:hypothetical protein
MDCQRLLKTSAIIVSGMRKMMGMIAKTGWDWTKNANRIAEKTVIKKNTTMPSSKILKEVFMLFVTDGAVLKNAVPENCVQM